MLSSRHQSIHFSLIASHARVTLPLPVCSASYMMHAPPGTETGALSVVDIIIILTLSAFISIILSLATLSNEITLLAAIFIQSTVSECYT